MKTVLRVLLWVPILIFTIISGVSIGVDTVATYIVEKLDLLREGLL